MRALAPVLLALVGCTRDVDCCESADCSSEGVSGTEVLRFRGEVPRNLLFLSVDTLRRDHVGELTPFLERLSSQGVVATDLQQCSNWTAGSMPCWVGGRTNIERGHLPRSTGLASQRPPVPDDTPFLASWLGDAGHVSSLVTVNTRFSKDYGNTQGYDQERWINKATAVEAVSTGATRIRKLSKGGARPWFLHVHIMEPHQPYDPPDRLIDDSIEPWREQLTGRVWPDYWNETLPTLAEDEAEELRAYTRELYAADVRLADERLEEAFAELDADCLLDDTLVVLFSDHGEAFWEHGYMTHGGNLTAEEADGVLIFWAKNLEPGVWSEPVSSIDLVPTVLDLYDVPVPTEVTGYPLGTAPADRPLFAEAVAYMGPVQSVVHEGWKLQFTWKTGRVRVWDRNRDRAEITEIYDAESPQTQALWALMKPVVQQMETLVIGGPDVVWPEELD